MPIRTPTQPSNHVSLAHLLAPIITSFSQVCYLSLFEPVVWAILVGTFEPPCSSLVHVWILCRLGTLFEGGHGNFSDRSPNPVLFRTVGHNHCWYIIYPLVLSTFIFHTSLSYRHPAVQTLFRIVIFIRPSAFVLPFVSTFIGHRESFCDATPTTPFDFRFPWAPNFVSQLTSVVQVPIPSRYNPTNSHSNCRLLSFPHTCRFLSSILSVSVAYLFAFWSLMGLVSELLLSPPPWCCSTDPLVLCLRLLWPYSPTIMRCYIYFDTFRWWYMLITYIVFSGRGTSCLASESFGSWTEFHHTFCDA